jgi:hypothetical protein
MLIVPKTCGHHITLFVKKIIMKKTITLFACILFYYMMSGQTPPCSVLSSVCTGTNTVSDFRNPTVFSGTDLQLNVEYKFNNVITLPSGSSPATLDAIVKVTALVDAQLEDVDDDAANSDASGTIVAVPDWFAPRIKANFNNFACTDRRGYVEFLVTFYPHFTGTILPVPYQVAGLNFVHYDMDGHTVGSNGWFKEIGYEQVINATNPQLLVNSPTELTNGGTQPGNYNLYSGSTVERNGVSQCAEVAIMAKYSSPQSSLSFRMGYDYRAPTSSCSGNQEATVYRQYGARFACMSFPTGGPLPVSLINLSASYQNGISTINWTTAQEIGIGRYEIQRSTDGVNFTGVGSVTSRNMQSIQHYKFEDNTTSINAKYLYYRIGIYDNNAGYKVSTIVAVRTEEWKNTEMVISPNPSRGHAQLLLKSATQEDAMISLIDVSGRQVSVQQVPLQKGNNSLDLPDLSRLPNGLYTVKLIAGKNVLTTKLVIWK